MVKRIYLLVLAAFALTLSAQNKEQENNAIRKLGIAQYAISHLYVDSVNAMKLTEGAITGMLSQLDPHSHTPMRRRQKHSMNPCEATLKE